MSPSADWVAPAGADGADDRDPRIAVVTDSTSALRPDEAAALGVTIVPLHVIVDDVEHTEGVDIAPEQVMEALRRGRRVSTSRPSSAAMLECYEGLAAQGAQSIVSAHLSAQLSGTCDAARLAAREAPVPVHVVDSGSTGLALGYAVAAAVRGAAPAQGDDVDAVARGVAEEIGRRCGASTVFCYVHTLEHLRRGGRIGAAASFLGGALAIKPIIALRDGHVEPVEKLRTSGRALSRLTELSVQAAEQAGRPLRLAVQHADALERAQRLAAELTERLDPVGIEVRELPAVLGVHLGPGTVAAVVAPA